jgi:CheY-like chemotaxis protein
MAIRKLKSVLCLDDDEDICEVLQTTLCLIAGLDVQTTRSGEAMIDLARKRQPDLVLMDMMMPDLDGPAVFQKMRADGMLADIPVIFLTAKVMPSDVAPLCRLGALGVITKPFDPLKLVGQISALWDGATTARATVTARDLPAQAHPSLDVLILRFLERATSDVVRLRKMIEQARQGNAAMLEEVEHITHSIHGTGAMLGFDRVSALGEAIERLAAGITANAEAHGPLGESALLPQLSEYTERLAQAVAAAARAAPSGTGAFTQLSAKH